MTGVTMAKNEHKLISTPVSVNDGFKRADASTWTVLLISAAVAIAIVAGIALFVEKPKVRWPTSPKAPAAAPTQPADQPSEPRTYDVAPPGAAPAPEGSHR